MAANRWTCVRAVGVVLFAAIVVAGGPGRAGAADDPPRLVDADNPAYKGWADRKPGTWLKIRGQFGEAADRKNATLTEGTHVLAAVTPEKVTLKVTQRLTTAGRAGDERTREHDEPARTQVPWTAVKVRPKTEKVTVPAGTFECTVIERTGTGVKQTEWTHPSVPGGIVKAIYTTGKAESTMEAVGHGAP